MPSGRLAADIGENTLETKKKRTLKSVDLFVGGGGLALGTARAGVHVVVAIDFDPITCETLRANKVRGIDHVRNWNIVEQDVRKYDFTQYQDQVDLVCGGPPCQPFSCGGKHLGRQDKRNLFAEAIRGVREVRPKAFIFENVKGLIRRDFLMYFNYILLQLEFPSVQRNRGEKWTQHRARLERLHTGGKFQGLRYQVVSQSLQATDHGVAQRRERVFIVGVKADLGIEYSFPLPTHSRDNLLYDQWVTGDYWELHKVPKRKRPELPPALANRVAHLKARFDDDGLERWQTVRDAIRGLPVLAVGSRSSKVANHFLNPGARTYAKHTGSDHDMPAKTLKAGFHGVPGGENMLRFADGSVRYFSVRECARLQCFPDNWKFEGAWTRGMRQVGNAVPVTLAESVAMPLARALQEY